MTFEEIAKSAMTLSENEYEAVAKKAVADYSASLKRMNAELKDLYARVLDGVKPKDQYNIATKYDRLTGLIESMQKEYLALSKVVGGKTLESAEAAIRNSYYRNMYTLNWGVDTGVFVQLSESVVDVSVYGTDKAWKEIADTKTFGLSENYIPQSGTLIEQLITVRNPEMLAKIERIVRAGLITGDGYKKTAAQLKALMETDAASALRIIRTESHRNVQAGLYAEMMAARSLGVEGRRTWVSSLDTRTREAHASADGQVEDVDGYFTVAGYKTIAPGQTGVAAQDISCRCNTIMTVDGVPPELRRGRDPVTGKSDIISWKSFDQWAKDNGLKWKNGKLV